MVKNYFSSTKTLFAVCYSRMVCLLQTIGQFIGIVTIVSTRFFKVF